MKHLAVVLQGGLVDRYISDDPVDVPELLVIDLDTEGLPEEDLVDVVSFIGDETQPAFVSERACVDSDIDLEALAAAVSMEISEAEDTEPDEDVQHVLVEVANSTPYVERVCSREEITLDRVVAHYEACFPDINWERDSITFVDAPYERTLD